MDLRALKYFVAIHEEKSMTAAAELCCVSQPSLSNAVSGLEQELGVALFVRHKRGVSPTSDGDRLYHMARRLLSDASSIKSSFSPPDSRRSIRIGVMTAINVDRVMVLLSPLLENNSYEISLTRADEECDVRLVCQEAVNKQESYIELWREPFVVAVPEGHPLAIKPDIVLADLCNAPLVARKYCTANLIEAGRVAGLEFKVVATAYSEEWAIALVNQGVGVAILPANYIRSEHRIVARTFSNMSPVRSVGLAYLNNKGLPENIKETLLKANEINHRKSQSHTAIEV